MQGRAIVQFIFFGNYFYGFCAVALSVEGWLKQHNQSMPWSLCTLLFPLTVWFYTHSYQRSNPQDIHNIRVAWYLKHKKIIGWLQGLHLIIALASLLTLLNRAGVDALTYMPPLSWFLLAIFPAVAMLYYGADHNLFKKISLRQWGWLKPFTIGFVWAGMVTVYPSIFHDLENHLPYSLNRIDYMLFLKNFLFVSLIGIMFDIKDHAHDHHQSLRTFIVRAGLRKTIFMILVPLSVFAIAAFLADGMGRNQSEIKVMLTITPFVLLILVALSLIKRRRLLYYLVVVDGLLLVKALCGIIAVEYF